MGHNLHDAPPSALPFWDQRLACLGTLALIWSLNGPSWCSTAGDMVPKSEGSRIPFLAAARNKALEPMWLSADGPGHGGHSAHRVSATMHSQCGSKQAHAPQSRVDTVRRHLIFSGAAWAGQDGWEHLFSRRLAAEARGVHQRRVLLREGCRAAPAPQGRHGLRPGLRAVPGLLPALFPYPLNPKR